jgi:hypothetical protein
LHRSIQMSAATGRCGRLPPMSNPRETPNHAMERTAGSFGSSPFMKFQPQLEATRSPAPSPSWPPYLRLPSQRAHRRSYSRQTHRLSLHSIILAPLTFMPFNALLPRSGLREMYMRSPLRALMKSRLSAEIRMLGVDA